MNLGQSSYGQQFGGNPFARGQMTKPLGQNYPFSPPSGMSTFGTPSAPSQQSPLAQWLAQFSGNSGSGMTNGGHANSTPFMPPNFGPSMGQATNNSYLKGGGRFQAPNAATPPLAFNGINRNAPNTPPPSLGQGIQPPANTAPSVIPPVNQNANNFYAPPAAPQLGQAKPQDLQAFIAAAQDPNNPAYAGGIGMYKPTGDMFTGTRNGQNFLLGNLWAPEGLAQGGGQGPVQSFAFTNYLRHNLPQYLSGLQSSGLQGNQLYGNLSSLLGQIS